MNNSLANHVNWSTARKKIKAALCCASLKPLICLEEVVRPAGFEPATN